MSLQKGKVAGTLPNGSYQVVMAYTVNENKISDYIGFSDVQSLFSHENLNGSLEITVSDIDTDFDEFEDFEAMAIEKKMANIEVTKEKRTLL